MYSSSSLPSEKQNPQQPWSFSSGPSLVSRTRFPMWKCHCFVCHGWRVFRLHWAVRLNLIGVMLQTSFQKKAEKLFFEAFIAFIWEQTLSRLAKTRFGNSLVLAFLQAGVTIEEGASWKLGPTTHSIYCCCSMSLVSWECEGRNKGYWYSLGFYV